MRCFYSDTFVLPLPEGHRFPMAKYSGLRERAAGREASSSADDLHEAPQASWDDLRLVHTADYVAATVERARCRAKRSGALAFPGRRRWSSARADRWARPSPHAGAALDGGLRRQPRRRHASRVCRSRRRLLRLQRRRGRDVACCSATPASGAIAVIDCDVHQGNGTAAIFAGDRDVFTFSMHGARNYPFRKETSDLDVELEDGTGDEPYLEHLAHSLDMVLRTHDPEVVFYLAGADPFEGDRLGRLKLTIDGLDAATSWSSAAAARTGLPVVVTMSGGYAHDVDDIVTIHANTIRVPPSITMQLSQHLTHPMHLSTAGTCSTCGTYGTRGTPAPPPCNASASSPKTTSSRCCRMPELIAAMEAAVARFSAGEVLQPVRTRADGRTDARLLRPDAGLHRAAGAAGREARHRIQREPRARAAVAPGDHRAARSRHRRRSSR